MTSPEGPKGSSPLRVGGLALVGVGVVAGILGVVGLNTASVPTPVAAPSQSTAPTSAPAVLPPAPGPSAAPASPAPDAAAPAPGALPAAPAPGALPAPGVPPAPGAAPAPAPAPGPAAPAPAPTPAPAPPRAPAPDGNAGAARSGGGAKAGATAARTAVRVYNNSTITGLAAGAAEDFRRAGWTVNEVANYASGIIPTSTVYYRPGTGEQGSAERMGGEFGLRAAPRFAGLTDASPGLIVIVTNDYRRH